MIGRAAGETEKRRPDESVFDADSELVLVSFTPENRKRKRLELRIGGMNEIIGALNLFQNIECPGCSGFVDERAPSPVVPAYRCPADEM